MLDIQKLEKSFGEKRAVQGLSFTVEKGTVLGFLGPNGAGKSTSMRMISGVLEPDSGDALIDGKSIVSARREAQAALGSLDRIARVVKLGAFISSTPEFNAQPKVANGASDLMVQVFGPAGQHARSAVGVPVLPLGAAVEIDAIVAVRPA